MSFPIFLITDFLVRRSIRQDAAKARSQVRRWLGYVSLLLAALSLAAVAATTFNSFLEGALSAQVVAQALLTAVMAGLIFLYILAEMEA